jgi:flagellar hook-basal body complex protein FliE
MAFAPIAPLGADAATAAGVAQPGRAGQVAAAGFGDALQRGLSEVSALEHGADAVAQNLATGGGAQVHDLMIATTKASIGVELLTAVRNRAVEAYAEVMRLQL